MKSGLLWIAVCVSAGALAAADAPPPVATAVEKMADTTLNAAQRNNACYELRENTSPEVIQAMRAALGDQIVRACAGKNLRHAAAIDELKDALKDSDPGVRALAARELGSFEKPELLPLIAAAARDSELLVASNAIEGLSNYRDTIVVPYLLDIAKTGGLIGTQALNAVLPFGDLRTIAVSRLLIDHTDISDKLAAMRALGQIGDASDLPKLRDIERKETETVSANNRGFGLMPAISVSRAARTAIGQIEARVRATAQNR